MRRATIVGGFHLLVAAWLSAAAQADTLVEFDTSLGSFEVELYDNITPITVDNFLNYVTSGRYDDSIIHRSVANLLIQGGGYYPDGSEVPTDPPIINEASPLLSNTRGTLAAARTPDPNSAQSQWYINTADNSFLDADKWVVFGQVLGNGMDVVDAIAALPVFNVNSNVSAPLRNYTQDDFTNGVTPTADNYVIVNISVVPEPSSLLLAAVGVASVVAYASRRRARLTRSGSS